VGVWGEVKRVAIRAPEVWRIVDERRDIGLKVISSSPAV
jgi:hypothetical protein